MLCPRTQQANFPACSPKHSLNAERQAGEVRILFFKVFWYDSTRGLYPRSTNCEADVPTITPLRRNDSHTLLHEFSVLESLPIPSEVFYSSLGPSSNVNLFLSIH